jgi:hypothetical protein
MKYPKIKIVPIPKIPTTTNELRVNADDLLTVDTSGRILKSRDFVSESDGPEPREEGLLKGHGYWLSRMVEWVIVEDDRGSLVLLPLRRK